MKFRDLDFENDRSGQIIATSHGSLTSKGSGLEEKSPYLSEIQVGEIL